MMKPTVAGAGLGMPPEWLSVRADVAIHKIEGIGNRQMKFCIR